MTIQDKINNLVDESSEKSELKAALKGIIELSKIYAITDVMDKDISSEVVSNLSSRIEQIVDIYNIHSEEIEHIIGIVIAASIIDNDLSLFSGILKALNHVYPLLTIVFSYGVSVGLNSKSCISGYGEYIQ